MGEAEMLQGLAIPALVAGAGMLALRAIRLCGLETRRALAIGCAYVAGHVVVAGWPGLPPASAAGWIPWLCLPVGVAAWALATPGFPAPGRRLAACAAAAAVPYALLRPLLGGTWSAGQAVLALVVTSLAILGGWSASVRLERQWPPVAHLGHLAFCVAGAAATIVLSGSLGLARMAGALAAAVASVAVVGRAPAGGKRGASSSVLTLGILASILIAAAAYADLPWWGAACLWLSTLAGWASRLLPATGLQGWKCASVVMAMTAALIAPPFVAALVETLTMQGE